MPGSTVNILLVEDDEVMRMAIRRAIAKSGLPHPLLEARDGLEALEMLRGTSERPPLARPFFLLLDLNMPRMNGIELLQEMRTDPRLQSTVVFVLSTSSAEEDIRAAFGHNVAGYFVKTRVGINFGRLIGMLETYLELSVVP